MKTMTVEAAVRSIPEVTEWIDAELEKLLCPIKARMQIDIAIDEILSNIVEYEMVPLLQEYWFDAPEMVAKWTENLRNSIA